MLTVVSAAILAACQLFFVDYLLTLSNPQKRSYTSNIQLPSSWTILYDELASKETKQVQAASPNASIAIEGWLSYTLTATQPAC
eukprot:m.132348 g.132348  ORF g.132348 m.132348 type:complete len:84 (+) comp15925_c0_seq12:133-384(+)